MTNKKNVQSTPYKVITFEDPMCGYGKTTKMLDRIEGLTSKGQNALIALPTQEMIDQVYDDFHVNKVTGVKKVYDGLTGNLPVGVNIQLELRDYTTEGRYGGRIVLITHESLLKLKHNDSMQHWNLFIDEVPEVINHTYINMEEDNEIADKKYLFKHFDVASDGRMTPATGYRTIVNDIAAGKHKVGFRNGSEVFKDLCKGVSDTNQIVKCMNPEALVSLDFITILDPNIVGLFKAVILLSANTNKVELVRVWRSLGVQFQEGDWFTGEITKGHKAQSGLINFYYLTEGTYSISSHTGDDPDLIEIQTQIFRAVEDKFQSLGIDYIYCKNNDTYLPNFVTGKGISPVSHGLNTYREYQGAAFLGAFNRHPVIKLFMNSLEITNDEIRDGFGVQKAYQFFLRTAARNWESDGIQKHFILGSKADAELLAKYFDGCTVSKLDGINLPVIKSGPKASEFIIKDKKKAESIVKRYGNGKGPTPIQEKWAKERGFTVETIMTLADDVLEYFDAKEKAEQEQLKIIAQHEAEKARVAGMIKHRSTNLMVTLVGNMPTHNSDAQPEVRV